MKYEKKQIILIIKVMNGGGAERVLSLLANHFYHNDFDVSILLTHQSLAQADLRRVDSNIQVLSVEDHLPSVRRPSQMPMLWARAVGKAAKCCLGDQDTGSIKKYAARNHEKLKWMKRYFREHSHAVLIAFLYDAIFLSLLAKTSTNRLIISERGDPCQSLHVKTDMAFIRKMFPKADAIVFQSPDVRKWYREQMGIDGQVIFNPIMEGLPEPYIGERKPRIVNFCRLSPQKNLLLLIEAFELLHHDYPEYSLWIYGDPDSSAPDYVQQFYDRVKASDCRDYIHVLPAVPNIHSLILDSAMFVSSSDFEGMSNSMLEAMAIGLPVVCTDCPAGGARAVIRDHENGLLVPIKDAKALYVAMKEIIERPELSSKLSNHAVRIREEQSMDRIMKQWEKLLFEKD